MESTYYECPMHPDVKNNQPGMCPECGMKLVPTKAKQIYTCPMHPDVRQDHEGMCSECGMRLVPEKSSHSDHKESNKHQGHSTNIFKVKFWISLFLSIPVVAYSDVVQTLLRYRAPEFPGSRFIPLALASIIFFYGGSIFIVSAWRELRARQPGMMTLIALAISTAYIYSLWAVGQGSSETLFWELATLITIMLLGHWLEMRAVTGARGALKELSKLLPDQAEVIRDGKTVLIALEEVRVNDTVLVKPGAKIPTDGKVIEGVSEVDESIATGESKPVPKQKDQEVIAGTINGDGSLTIRVTQIGEHTFLAGVMRLVAEAQASKSRLQLLSDRAAYYLTIVAVVTGGITFASWLAVANPAFAVERMVAVLVIACPHALGLAIPLVASISTTKAARNGFLVKQRMALEAARNIDTVVFDKTGTLTKGEFGVAEIISMEPGKEIEVLQSAAAVNSHSEHPIARAIVREARQRVLAVPEIKNFQRIAGKGAQAQIGNETFFVGSTTLAAEHGIPFNPEFQRKSDAASRQGKTVIFVMTKEKIVGAIALADIIREESRLAIRSLHVMGVKTAMITGDSEDVAHWVAGELGIQEYFSKVLPEAKSEKIKMLQSKGQKVAMVGDGVNDAPALTQADLGIAIGAGTNVAIESAGIVLIKNDPQDIPKIIKLSRMTYSKMIQNLFWAAGYNILAIPLAAGVLAFKGIFLQPAVAALFMSLSTVIVAINAMLLRKAKL